MKQKIGITGLAFMAASSIFSVIGFSCKTSPQMYTSSDSLIKQKVNEFIKVKLTTDLSVLSENDKKILPLFFKVGQIMDDLYWQQAWGDKQELLSGITDENLKAFVEINYGAWERLNGNKSFIDQIGAKPEGANFYPVDMTKDEFEKIADSTKTSEYTVIRRNAAGAPIVVPYNLEYNEGLKKASELLKKASDLAEDEGLKYYLKLRSEALITGNYFDSDMAWLDMKQNNIDFVVGPIETYEDALFGQKASFEAYILVKDHEWSYKLKRFATLLPVLQQSLPVEQKFKSETPGTDSDLGAYDVLFYGGDCNAGSKTIAINLPNDSRVQLAKGSRKLQLKNAMRAKFDHILVPISQQLIVPEQISNITFDAFFENTMFHEVAHGLGIKNTINGKGEVQDALKETASPIEEAKADILGLYMVTKLTEMGQLGENNLMDYYVTFLAGIFRSVRFGAASAHGKANMMRFNYFEKHGAFSYNEETGLYRVNFDAMKQAVSNLSADLIILQGNGDYDLAKNWLETKGVVPPSLQKGLDKISSAGIPRDIVFEQGETVVGL